MTTTAPTATPATTSLTLTAADRCDAGACGAQARAVITLASGGVLLFCRHHTEKNTPSLVGAGAHIDTQYDGLTPTRA